MAMFYSGYWFIGSLGSNVFYIIAAVFTVTGNLLVIVTFLKDPYGRLQKRCNYFLLNLALSDIIMGACVDPLLVAAFWTKSAKISNSLLYAHFFFAIVSGASSLLNLTALSIIRYYALKDPFGYESMLSRKRVTLGLTSLWLQSLHLAFLPILGWTSPSYQIYLYSVGFFIPTIAIFLAYYGVFRRIRSYTLGIVAVDNTVSTSPSPWYIYNEGNSQSGARDRAQSLHTRKAIEREKSITKTLVIVMIVFVISWLPLIVVDIFMVQCKSCRNWTRLHLARDISLSLTYFSSGVNPILYTLRMRQFRIALLKLLNVASIDFALSVKVGNKRLAVGALNTL